MTDREKAWAAEIRNPGLRTLAEVVHDWAQKPDVGPVGGRLYPSLFDRWSAAEDARAAAPERLLVGPDWPQIVDELGPEWVEERGNMHELTGMEVTVRITTLMATLKENREQHKQMVAEAREGYVKRTLEMLEEKMGQLRSGKLIRLSVSMAPPEDHSATYDTAIRMLELHTGTEMKLHAGQVRNLVMDEWDWSHTWYAQNMRFSDTAAKVGATKGYSAT